MSEKTKNNPDYKFHYPNAIEDTDLAHDMAEAGNRTRTLAARKRAAAMLALKFDLTGDSKNAFNKAYDEALENSGDRQADATMDALVQFPHGSDNAEPNIATLKKEAAAYDQEAEGREASAEYWHNR